MGLDMYLSAQKYVCMADRTDAVAEALGLSGTYPVSYVTLELYYWRKANAIHQWFVDNVQSGEDDCKNYLVSSAQLLALVQALARISADHSLASALLPTSGGFFFGDVEYDERYFETVTETHEKLLAILADSELASCDFYYQSSW